MRNTKYVLPIILFIVASVTISVHGQNLVNFTQFAANPMLYNPALTGEAESMQINGTYRYQWIEIEGAPVSAQLSIQSAVKDRHFSWGLNLMNDQIGMSNQSEVGLYYAYSLTLGDRVALRLGLNAAGQYNTMNWDKARPTENGDPYSNQQASYQFAPNFGAGISIGSNNWNIGFSSRELLASPLYSHLNQLSYRSWHGIASAYIPINENWGIEPNVMITMAENYPLDVDMNAIVKFRKMVFVQMGYRLHDSINTGLFFFLNRQFLLGLSYDFTISSLRYKSNGSMEIGGAYLFNYQKEKIRNLRYF